MRRLLTAAAVLLALSAATLPLFASGAGRARWDTRVFAKVGSPGFPAHAYVAPDNEVYEGTYVNPMGDMLPSNVFEYSPTGDLRDTFQMPGQVLSGEHGVQVATSDAGGRLVLLDHTPPRAVILNPDNGRFSDYARFPSGSVPNYAVWLPDGSLLVSDYEQPIIWRIPPGGGAPEQWLTDPRLAGNGFGTTGLALTSDHKSVLIGQQLAGDSPSLGAIYKVALKANGDPDGGLNSFWTSSAFDLPDGFAIAKSGRIYVALLGPNQIAVLSPADTEQARFPSLLLTGDNGSGVPFDQISSVAFLGTSLIAANQSYLANNTANQVLFDIETNEPGVPELIPANAGYGPRKGDTQAPRLRRVRVSLRGLGRLEARVRFRLSERATVTARLSTKGSVVGRVHEKRAAGRRFVQFVAPLPAGRYQVAISAVDAAGNRSRVVHRRLRVR